MIEVDLYQCLRSEASVHYTLVCDFQQHCPDRTDEDFCYIPPCPADHFACSTGQCLPISVQCNGVVDCPAMEDEICNDQFTISLPSPPVKIDMDGGGGYTLQVCVCLYMCVCMCVSVTVYFHEYVCVCVYL